MRGSLTFGSYEFDPNSRLLKRDGVELQLPPRVLGVLEVLLRRAGDVVPRQELIDNVWRDAFVTDTSLAEAVSLLRQALGDDPQSPSFIQTFHRRGYRFVAPVAVQSPPATPPPQDASDVPSPSGLPSRHATTDGPSIGMQLVPWSVAAACAILASVAVWQAVSKRELPLQPTTRFTIAPPAGTRFDSRAPAFALSADGSLLAFSACEETCRLYIRPSDRLEASPLAGTEDGAGPFFSPDGRWIAFFADGHLRKVSLSGGAAVTLAEAADPAGGAWTANGQIIYAGAGPRLHVIPETGGEPVTLTSPNPKDGGVRHVRPALVADTRFLLFTMTNGPGPDSVGRIALLDLSSPSRPPAVLLANAGSAVALSKDVIAFSTGSELQVAGLDLARGRIAGAPQTALTKLATTAAAAQFAAAPDGTSIALTAEPAPTPTLFWTAEAPEASPAGTRQKAVPLDGIRGAVLSPDGRRVAGFNRDDSSKSDLWIGDLVTGTATRMTHGETAAAPVWNRAGTAVWFASSASGTFAVYQREVDSLQPARRVYAGSQHAFPASASPDGSTLAITMLDPATGADIWTLGLAGGDARPLIRTPSEEVAAAFSPNGQLLAYQSDDSGRWEIYTHRLSDHRRMPVSSGGGTFPFWSPDGTGVFFVSGNRLMRAAIGPDGATIGGPAIWSRQDAARAVGIEPRGRVLFERNASRPAAAILTRQWDREVRRLLGPPSPALLR
ncbi:MAG: winged helix-turn-helix domain-containing protein [Vicinamibacterales bacterium]